MKYDNRCWKKKNQGKVPEPFVRLILGRFSNRTGTSFDEGKARGKKLNSTSGAQFAALPLVPFCC